MNIAPRTQPMPAFDCTQSVRRYQQVRDVTTELCRNLTPEDMALQSMPDASPAKWHLAHSSWFFEHFLLAPYLKDYRPFDPQFNYLFNSYYYTVGGMHPRSERGLLSRPGVAEVAHYRAHVDEHMHKLLGARGREPELAYLATLGLNHEQQHQELLLMDIKHLFARNPLQPRWREPPAPVSTSALPLKFIPRPEGLLPIGHAGSDFAFDNETPRHRVFIQAHALANRLTTNNDYLEFIRAGGYSAPALWLSDGWATLQREGWNRPLYWNQDMTAEFTLGGERELASHAPVCHVSYYEADAFARWAGARLPTEAEWESMAAEQGSPDGNFQDSGWLHPRADVEGVGMRQLFGDVWEWTSSAYLGYPGFRASPGTLGEYNGKFMCGQWVLRGGSCATPGAHIRASYRNFFHPADRWQFMGLR